MEYNERPAGYYFTPTNKDLVKFLTEKVTYNRLPPCIVKQNLYGKNAREPWKLFRGKATTHVYFFTTLDRKSPNGSNLERTTVHGTWKGQATTYIPERPKSKKVIGKKKNYRFELKKGFDSSITGCLHPWRYVMHEYSLPDNGLNVICKIIRYPMQKSGKEVELEELLEEEALVVEQPKTSDHQGPLEPTTQNTRRNKRRRVVRRPPSSSNAGGANEETMSSELRTEELVQSVSSSPAVGNQVQQRSDDHHHQVKEKHHQVVYNNFPSFVEMMQPHHPVFGTSSLGAQSFNFLNESLFTSHGDDGMNGLISSSQDFPQPHISTAPPRVDDSLLQPLPPQLENLTASSGYTNCNAMPSSLSAAPYVMGGSAAPSEYILPLLPPRVDDVLLRPLPPQLENLTASSGYTNCNAMPSSLSAAPYVMGGSAAPSEYILPLLPPRVDDFLLRPLPPQLGNLTASSGNTIYNAIPSSLWSSSLLSAADYVIRDSAAASSDYILPSFPPPSLPGEVVIPPHVDAEDANLSPSE